MKKISLLGSTGSIGRQTLDIAKHLKDEVQIVGLATRSNIDLLQEQVLEFSPKIVGIFDEAQAKKFQQVNPHCTVVAGREGLEAVAAFSEADFVVSAISGTHCLSPTVAAIRAGKQIGLANKECLVSAGKFITDLARKHSVDLIPIDSEHSAIFQCLQGQERSSVSRIILTASGGPFRTYSFDQLQHVTPEQALMHPNWRMGPKVTIDCSTLMNKGLEVIEAHWLFDIPFDKIEVVIHPQSIIHSMVEYCDGSILAQMGEPKMTTPIQYAITYPKRKPGLLPKFDFSKNSTLQFFSPNLEKFSCLKLAFESIKIGESFPCYMNAANEILVDRFLKKEIGWLDIGKKLHTLLEKHRVVTVNSLDSIYEIEIMARKEAERL